MVSGTDDSFSLCMRGTRSTGWQYSAINFLTSLSASNPSMFWIEGVMYRKDPLRDKMCMKFLVILSLANCFYHVFLDVGAMVLIEMSNELMKVGSERRVWSSFNMIALHLHGGGAGRDGMAGAPAL